jgi:hypothetical protein
MPDVWATVTELDPAMQERLAGVLEARGCRGTTTRAHGSEKGTCNEAECTSAVLEGRRT